MSGGMLGGLLFVEGLAPSPATDPNGGNDERAASPSPPAAQPAPVAAELPFDVAAMLRQGIRVSQAEFARMVGVSRAAVTEWKKAGLIDVGPDGKLNPAKAARQLSERADPARLRAPLLRQAMESTSAAQARAKKLGEMVATLRAELAAAQDSAARRETAAEWRERDAAAVALARFQDAIDARFPEAIDSSRAGRLPRWLDELAAVEFYGMDLAEYRADSPLEDDVGESAP